MTLTGMTLRVSGAWAGAVAALVGGLLVGTTTPAAAADGGLDVDERVASWDLAAARLGTAGSLWEPQETAALERTRRIAVIADNLAFANGAVTAGDTFAGTRYGTAKRSFWIEEKWADTGWAAEPVTSTSTAKVRNVRVRLGSPGMTTTVTARVYADCVEQPADADPEPIPAGFRCTRGDVLRDGGTLVMTARPASQMTAPGTTSIVIRSTGLTFAELVGVARSLEQVAGSAGGGRRLRADGRDVPADGRPADDVRAGQCLRRVERVLRARGQHRRPVAAGHGRLPPGPLHRVDGVGLRSRPARTGRRREARSARQDTMSLRSNRKTATATHARRPPRCRRRRWPWSPRRPRWPAHRPRRSRTRRAAGAASIRAPRSR